MTEPATVEPPAKAPPASEVEQLTRMLVAGATVATVAGFLSGLVGAGPAAVKKLMDSPEWPNLIELPAPWGVAHPAVMQQHLSNLRRRAAYLIMASRRLGTAVVREQTTPGSVDMALRQEVRFLRQHLNAVAHRNTAVKKVVSAAYQYGEELGWYAVRDARTSPECRAAHGSNFRTGEPPKIGYPGTVHNSCRCKPGPAHRDGRTVDEATAGTDRVRVVRGKEAIALSGDHSSSTHPDLPNKPGKTNWVEKSGGLPPYIKRVAKHIMADSGLAEGHAIAAAHNWCVKQAAKGNPQAAAAIAQWNAKAAAARAS